MMAFEMEFLPVDRKKLAEWLQQSPNATFRVELRSDPDRSRFVLVAQPAAPVIVPNLTIGEVIQEIVSHLVRTEAVRSTPDAIRLVAKATGDTTTTVRGWLMGILIPARLAYSHLLTYAEQLGNSEKPLNSGVVARMRQLAEEVAVE